MKAIVATGAAMPIKATALANVTSLAATPTATSMKASKEGP